MRIEVRNGSFGYRGRLLYDHFDLAVRENKVLTILGPNGVGKTTLLKCIMGFLPWRTGGTYLNGRELSTCRHRDVWTHISYVPQAKQSPFAFSVLDTVVMGLNAEKRLFSSPVKEDYERAQATLDWLDLGSIAHCSCNRISGGQLQMVLIARALVSEPEVLILDEPESNLDMCNQLRVLSAIQRIAEQGTTTCVINTHFPDHALMISDDTLFLGEGGVREFGSTSEVITEENIERFYRVRARVVSVDLDSDIAHTVFPYRLAYA